MRPVVVGAILFLVGVVALTALVAGIFQAAPSPTERDIGERLLLEQAPLLVLSGLLILALPATMLWEMGGWLRRGSRGAWAFGLVVGWLAAVLAGATLDGAFWAPLMLFVALAFPTVALHAPGSPPRDLLMHDRGVRTLAVVAGLGFVLLPMGDAGVFGALFVLGAPLGLLLAFPRPTPSGRRAPALPAAPQAPAEAIPRDASEAQPNAVAGTTGAPAIAANPGPPPTDALPLGTRYALLRDLSPGAFGRARVAEDTKLGRKVVIKELHPEWEREPKVRAAFLREARIAGQLNHPHVVTVHDVHDATPAAIVMEFVEGGSLAERLAHGRLPPAEAVRLCDEVLQGLERVHAEEVYHRDLKPANILLTREGRAKICDFGIAHAPGQGTAAPGLSMTGYQPGTVLYMAPEQVRGEPPDARTDLYAVGAILHETLTGQHYLGMPGADAFAMLKGVVEEPYRAPSGLSEPLRAVLRRALAKDRERRYKSAATMRASLAKAAAALPGEDRLEGAAAQAPKRAPADVGASGRRGPSPGAADTRRTG